MLKKLKIGKNVIKNTAKLQYFYCYQPVIYMRLNSKKTILDEWTKYRVSTITLLLMNVILTFIILIIVNEKIIIKYSVYIAIGVACYTFYITFDSIIKLIKYQKLKSPLVMASKVINVVSSLILFCSIIFTIHNSFYKFIILVPKKYLKQKMY